MVAEDMQLQNNTEMETKLYSKRWWIAVCMTIQILQIRLLMNSFGVINNIYKAYFDISYYVIDWFTLIQTPGRIVSTIILTLLSFNSIIEFRKLFIVMEACTLIACASLIMAFAFPHFYGLIFLGQFAAGFGFQTVTALVSTFATTWFPETQIGVAMSFRSIGMSIGCLVAFLVPTQLVPPLFSSIEQINMSNQIENITIKINERNLWINEVQWKFVLFYGVLLAICVMIFTCACLFVTEQPPKPPTIAQALVRSQKNYGQPKDIVDNLETFLYSCKLILFDKVVFQAVLICGFTFSSNDFQKLFMGQVVRQIFTIRKYGSLINVMSGYVIVCFEIGCFLGGIVSGQALDRFKKHKFSLCIALISSFLAMSGMVVGRHYYSTAAIFIFNALLGFSLGSSDIPLFDIVLQHTYPNSPTFVMLLFTAECNIVILIIGQSCRFVLNYSSATAALVFMTVVLLLSLVISIFLKPNYTRQETGSADPSPTEEIPLLENAK